ncbi:predicted protein [Scheffersomyces stipitis CBS 6054]|uniref:Uncharacterized protein n=1 Tax=Scheffersomyces stipitis (strain ATCC 58785 / CBS 6054 / NBRC 10063 / NRRL Y-11545) TaxID=322104 RepID=A3LRS3_PICST|nr:predicted protein [Scheffersomyces stipitis CBS 6054]ABN65783.2 predicted protein [Scheffersomyces stipitis CBS 6054]KAG2733537.1 hypothetical protein G9P44_003062 [Scheffersomyces stipitis]
MSSPGVDRLTEENVHKLEESYFNNTQPLANKLGGFKDLKGFDDRNFMLTSANRMYNALDSSVVDITTYQILRVHMLRIFLTIWTYFQAQYWYYARFWDDIKEINSICCYELNTTVQRNSSMSKYSAINQVSAIYLYLSLMPNVVSRVIYQQMLWCVPSGLSSFQLATPKRDLPETMTLILNVKNLFPAAPPEIPQPYLDSEKKIKVPDKKDVQMVLALRNDYFTQIRVNLAAEKVKLLTEVAKFVTWSALLPTTNELYIYERFGLLVSNSLVESLQNIADAILSELHSFSNACNNRELDEFKVNLPKIILVHMNSNERLHVNEAESTDPDTNTIGPESIDSIVSAGPEKRELIVYLCDAISRDETVLRLVKSNLDEIEFPEFNSIFPPSTDLVFVAEGYSNYDYRWSSEQSESVDSIFYFSHLPFGFNGFNRALYSFAIHKFKYLAKPKSVSFIDNGYDQLERILAPLKYIFKWLRTDRKHKTPTKESSDIDGN